MTPEQRRRAGRAIAVRVAEMNATTSSTARAAGISPNTLRALIAGERWPTDAVQGRIEAVLRWRAGEIVTRAVRGGRRGGTDHLTSVELAAELLRRLDADAKRGAKLRASDADARQIAFSRNLVENH